MLHSELQPRTLTEVTKHTVLVPVLLTHVQTPVTNYTDSARDVSGTLRATPVEKQPLVSAACVRTTLVCKKN